MATKVTQLVVEVLNRPPNIIKATQLVAEVINRPPNIIKTTQLCVEVVIRMGSQTYTDSAAGCDFTH